MAEIKLAKTAGFCFGVNRAVKMVDGLLDENQAVCTYGPIIHNTRLVENLASRGVIIADHADDVPKGRVLVIRSHGISKKERAVLESKAAKIVDATCPFVAKIHKIAEANTDAKTPLLIAGNENHAEVIGIKGYANGDVYVFKNMEELETLVKNHSEFSNLPVCVVSQTTFNAEVWKKCVNFLKKVYTNAKIFDTICDATTERQNESVGLAKTCDLMIIVGSKHSSNTKKLWEICRAHTKTLLIEDAGELTREDLRKAKRIGVTAGASAPAVIIKEVLNTMSEILENQDTPVTEDVTENEGAAANSTTTETNGQAAEPEVIEKSFDEMTFEEALEASLNGLNTDQKVKGTVISVNPSEVQVDIGRKQTGYIPAHELSNDPNLRPEDVVKVGDILDLIVMKTNDQEGVVTLSKRRFDAAAGFDKIVAAQEADATLEGTVTSVVKGGVTMICNGVRVFIPASQATLSRGEPLEDLIGKTYAFKILEIGRGRRVVGSIRATLKEQRKVMEEALWAKLEIGQVYTGTVKSLTSYGAFVDIGGVDGMIHISELSWTRIKTPSEVVNMGDTVEVFIKDLNPETHKISLGYRKAEDNPWEIFKNKYAKGDIVDVTIANMTAYGAFANIMQGIDGLIHISQITDRHIEKPQDALKNGDKLKAMITEIDLERKRVSLSVRALLEQDETISDETKEAYEPAEVLEETTEETAE